MYQVTGKTYEIRDQLKTMGFTWDVRGKCWIGGEKAVAKLNSDIAKWSGPTWGVARNTIAKSLRIVEVCCETCEI